MKLCARLLLLVFCATIVAACSQQKKTPERYNRKIYLTEEDYLEDLSAEAVKERREAPGAAESDYIFNIQPQISDKVYFFDEQRQPKVPGKPMDKEYKQEKRLWTKPRRFTPAEYYGMQGGGSSSSTEESYSSSEYY